MNSLVSGESVAPSTVSAIEVKRVEGSMVLFKALTGAVEFLQSILKMPFRLAEFT